MLIRAIAGREYNNVYYFIIVPLGRDFESEKVTPCNNYANLHIILTSLKTTVLMVHDNRETSILFLPVMFLFPTPYIKNIILTVVFKCYRPSYFVFHVVQYFFKNHNK